ncbi:poly [ADP-ribose] polymerase 15 isoform X1 [Paramuricea clavata]|uniref:Poly [ADP-ribose] polymerase 15 isoform X1 n=1 Tax=Paramuricea clavata TaxID=317549 RepID=A0A7D9EPD6_PARCT|nr:poly [ADP-ribose] polymerase 15 isoform X1 [Paramuricea clavata]
MNLGSQESPGKTDLSYKEEQVYVEKLTQMSVYTESLQKLIAKKQNDVDVAKKKDCKIVGLKRLLSVLRDKERIPYQALLEVEDVLRRKLPVSPQTSLDTSLPKKRPINVARAETSKKRIRVDGKIATGNKKTNFPSKLPGNVDFKTKHVAVVADGGIIASGTPTTNVVNLPYHSMTVVNDKEVKMALGNRITIIVGDVAQEKVDVIVNAMNAKVDLNASRCGKALLKMAGEELLNECHKIGSLLAGDITSTGPAKLNCKRVYHVRLSSWDNGRGAQILRMLIKKCLYQMDKDKLRSIAIPAIGTGALHFPRLEVAKIFFEEVTGHLTAHPQIDEVHFVAFDQATVDAFLVAVQQIKSVILSSMSKRVPVPLANAGSPNNVSFTEKLDGSLELSLGTTNLAVQIVWADIINESTDLIMHVIRDFSFLGEVGKALITAGGGSIIQEFRALGQPAFYSTQYTKAGRLAVHQIAHVIAPASIEVADLKNCVATFFDDVLKKNIARVSFSAIGVDAMGYTESQSADLIFDNLSRIAERKNPTLSLVRIVICEKAKFIKFKDATEAYFASWVVTRLKPPIERKFHKFELSTSSKEYQDIETAFHKSVSNHVLRIVRIEKVQNKEIDELYNVKRRAMMNKFGSNFAGKELWLFHGTSLQSIDKINANGLNRSYAGTHATSYGKGVYFARDASYSCNLTYSPPDWQGLRYMYYAKVLVGDYTRGNSSMIARPSKDTADPDVTYDSVVDNISHPNIYVLFQDYEYYTEYLITFR